MSYEIGDVVRPSASYLSMGAKRAWIKADTRGRVVGYKSPQKIRGEYIGRVMVQWEGTGMPIPMRWDQVTRA